MALLDLKSAKRSWRTLINSQYASQTQDCASMRWSLAPAVAVSPPSLQLAQDPEQLFEDLQILHPIGVGGFGVVYRGLYQCASVAVKLAVTSASDSTDRASVREALVSPQLRHPNVVTTFLARGAAVTEEFLEAARAGGPDPPPQRQGSGLLLPAFVSEDGLGDPCAGRHAREGWFEALSRSGARPGKTLVLLVQAFCERGTLSHAIRQGLFRPAVPPGDPAFPQQERLARRMLLRTAAEICRGLVHLHAANVIHGDLIKPANVLLAKTSDRRGFTVKVADFGMSHLLQDGSARCDSSSLGTLVYASPESMNGEHTKTSDVFSFGVILSEMLTGKRPYEHLMLGQIMLGVSLQGLRPPLPDSEWPELCALARRCMEQDPDARPSFRELESAMMDMENRLRTEAQRQSMDQQRLSLEQRASSVDGPAPPHPPAMPASSPAHPSPPATASPATPRACPGAPAALSGSGGAPSTSASTAAGTTAQLRPPAGAEAPTPHLAHSLVGAGMGEVPHANETPHANAPGATQPDAAVSLLSQADSADRLSLSLSLSGGGSGGGGGGSGGGAAEQPLSPSPWLTTSIPAEAFLQAPQPPAEQQQGGGQQPEAVAVVA